MATHKKILLNVMAHRYREKAVKLGENLPLFQYLGYFLYDKPRIMKMPFIWVIKHLGNNARLAKDL
jgi:hypothetical protein